MNTFNKTIAKTTNGTQITQAYSITSKEQTGSLFRLTLNVLMLNIWQLFISILGVGFNLDSKVFENWQL